MGAEFKNGGAELEAEGVSSFRALKMNGRGKTKAGV